MILRRNALLLLIATLRAVNGWFFYEGISAEDKELSCGLYLAHSPIFDSLGVFTAHSLEAGTNLTSQDVVIPLMEDTGPIWNAEDWSHLLGYVENEGRPVRAMLAGAGSAVNLHSNLHNIMPSLATRHPATTGLHRQVDAGVGAFSYQLMQYEVTDSIPAGGQIVLKNAAPIEDLQDDDYNHMDNLVREINELFKGVRNKELQEDTLRLIHSSLAHPVADSFPSNLQQFKRALKMGAANAWSNNDLQATIPWLKENGVCLDNVVPGESNVEQAGRGGFARRSMKKGTVVVPSPVIPVSRHDLDRTSDDYEENKQLLINYCFGHPKSSLLLCQYGSPSAYVNHGGGEKANVKLRWSTKLDSDHHHWSDKPVEEVLKHPFSGLVLELVAIKDIEVGEEVLLDYGPDWEYAWLEHVANWAPPEGAHEYTSASQWNSLELEHLHTQQEEELDPYPPNIYLGLFFHYDPSEVPETSVYIDGITHKSLRWSEDRTKHHGARRPVSILDRQEYSDGRQDTYTVQVDNHLSTEQWQVDFIPHTTVVTLTGVPRSALMFVDTLYSSDQHLPNAFRSEMHVPLDLYPSLWLDAEHSSNEDNATDKGFSEEL